ncbi:G-protein coupled receptors family 1 profile domain-containing protein [Caenorhabditis elegans]|uniref:G-protein coupled receptors family 1 profile domain-containing protein n=1 Tax=Caenorhabditis elegans TaxID=6239 RepID=O16937_CAEEL|nr:G-protein coupled receptors family 1 profile domain-containing protein [Caenorhabditis elegans]CCD62601.1 G-protein coupled receptors family 1 profile domain-containing protein [Caenorhabditis elegans]|eukprot:NP_504336.2 Serpentine Receptor, class SX [Caenorhabditis elegans]
MEFLTLNLYFVVVYKILFIVFGTIGNSLFIHLIFKRKQLQTRTSVLQCFQCSFQTFCLFGTLFDGIINLGHSFNRRECFWQISFYIFFQAAQGIIMLVIVIDILIFVKYPFFYRSISFSTYLIATSFPVLMCSTVVTAYSYYSVNEEVINTCVPMFVLSNQASTVYKLFIIFINIIVTVVYVILIRTFHLKKQTGNLTSLKTIKGLQFSVSIFIFTWFFSQIIALLILKQYSSSSWENIIYMHNSFLMSLSYSNTFYVTLWKSKEYRKQFKNIWYPERTNENALTVFYTHSLV